MSSLPDIAHKPLESNYIIHIPKFFKDDDSKESFSIKKAIKLGN